MWVVFVVFFIVLLKLVTGVSIPDEMANIFYGGARPTCTPASKEREFSYKPYYEEPLIDVHLHLPTSSKVVSVVSTEIGLSTPVWDKELTLDYVHCLLKTENRPKAFGFHLTTKYSAAGEVRMAKRMEKRYPGEIAHFLMPALVSQWINPSTQTVKEILEKNPGLFVGLGELKMYDGRDPDDPYMIELYELAKKHNLIIMMHPFTHHKKAVEKIVKQYPEVKFLLHGLDKPDEGPRVGKENLEWVTELIRKNKNVYYSVEHSLPIYGFKKEHVGKVIPKEELLPYMREEFADIFKQEILWWKSRIETYPDQFVGGGTDRFHRPQYDQEISALINEFERSFIAQFSPHVQEKFAYKNAEKLLGLNK